MKKRLTIILSLAVLMGLAGCSNRSEAETEATTAAQETEVAAEETTAGETESEASEENTETGTSEEADSEAGSGTLVVYYSATGNTEAAANYIADITGGDLFELEPVEPYTDDDLNWTDDNSRVTLEHEDESLRDVELVADTVDNWDSYDTVFIGYPIWWGIAAWPVDTFVEANDFTGKTVIPFCTSSSSGIGDSGNLLAEMAGTGDWQEGMRFSSRVAEEDVQEWLDSLGM
ncbi:flavodoxin [Clostridium sp. M62/1]|uniref:flavodoxin n=1 Tax=Clostridium sp. M62/1 TaxID=411486 RepID=UPI00019733C9|nr:flavodoxin [Clostridium sp. M62/1]EFE12862.1 flavodoxin family protein [Clostridium sp. M62/1]UEB79221.1 flavodoxin [Clostridium sp. M62/1]